MISGAMVEEYEERIKKAEVLAEEAVARAKKLEEDLENCHHKFKGEEARTAYAEAHLEAYQARPPLN